MGPDLPVFQDAADKLRIPYWDWASIPEIPPVLNQPNIQIKTPTGEQTVNNPLFQYKFLQFPLNPTYFPPDLDERAKMPYTVRQPASGGPNSPSRPEVVNAQLARGNLMQRTVSTEVRSCRLFRWLILFVSGMLLSSQLSIISFPQRLHQELRLNPSTTLFIEW